MPIKPKWNIPQAEQANAADDANGLRLSDFFERKLSHINVWIVVQGAV